MPIQCLAQGRHLYMFTKWKAQWVEIKGNKRACFLKSKFWVGRSLCFTYRATSFFIFHLKAYFSLQEQILLYLENLFKEPIKSNHVVISLPQLWVWRTYMGRKPVGARQVRSWLCNITGNHGIKSNRWVSDRQSVQGLHALLPRLSSS